MTTIDTPAERVARGTAWLDRQLGDDWHTHINLDRLALADECNCILGQLVADAAYAAKLAPDADDGIWSPTFSDVEDAQDIDMVEHGFDADPTIAAAGRIVETQYHQLDAAWAALIEQRLAR